MLLLLRLVGLLLLPAELLLLLERLLLLVLELLLLLLLPVWLLTLLLLLGMLLLLLLLGKDDSWLGIAAIHGYAWRICVGKVELLASTCVSKTSLAPGACNDALLVLRHKARSSRTKSRNGWDSLYAHLVFLSIPYFKSFGRKSNPQSIL